MRPQNQFGKDRAAEFCLLQLAIESTQQLPKFWSRLKRRPAGQLAADSAEAAVLDLYLLVWFWGYLRSQNQYSPETQEQFSGAKLRSRLRQLPFNAYAEISVFVHFDEELLAAA